ncbi:MAG TPA: SCO6880 family protein [Acidimicrobiales bacterium]|nr:SCO6880 family protein [Acidimicrobiales bacterium]
MPEETPRVRFRFGPLERRGLIAGWRGGQIASVAAGLMVAVLAMRAGRPLVGAVVALVALGASVALAMWPVGGRTLEQWTPDALRYATDSSRRRRDRSDPFGTLELLTVELASPGPRGGPAVRSAPQSSKQAAVVFDRAARTYTAVLGASGSGFVLAGEEEKLRRVGAWADVLSSLARDGSSVHRVQWVARNVPGGSPPALNGSSGDASAYHEHDAYNGYDGYTGHGSNRRSGEYDGYDAARRSYASLLRAQGELSRHHAVLVAVSVSPAKQARAVKAAGGGSTGACALVLREAGMLRRRIADAGIEAGHALSPAELARTLRSAFEAGDAQAGERSPARGGSRKVRWGRPSPPAGPWPMGVRSEWSRVLVDGLWHASYWISEWPRTDVGPDFLGPLLLLPEGRSTVSVVMEPLTPSEAARKIEQARTADIADSELRRKGGFLLTARRRREEEVLAQREAELADGYAPFRFCGYVTVSASKPGELDEACRQAEQAAARCGLELRLCYGDQARAFSATLPLGRGLC